MSVIRISGPQAIARTQALFRPLRGKCPEDMEGYTCSYGYVEQDGVRLDDVVLTVFRAPHSYTGEDVVEISCHGSRFLTQQILRAVLGSSVRPAQAGEFTRRAFLNGKLSLTQAEAVSDLIAASGETAVRYARVMREGATFRRISAFSATLLEMLSDLAVWADYPDEDIPEVDGDAIERRLTQLLADMQGLLATYDYGRILHEGLHTAVVGKPNVGKSTLFNALSGYDRSIVTEIAGTTRDVVEEKINLGGITLRLCDTAGIRDADDRIEQLGIARSEQTLAAADLILAVFDVSCPPTGEDERLMQKLPADRTIAVCNKRDLGHYWNPEHGRFADVVEISAKNRDGLAQLSHAVEVFAARNAAPAEDGMIANERQYACLRESIAAVEEALSALQQGLAYDAVTVSLDGAADALLRLKGERVTDQVVDAVFSRFCVGK